MVQCRPNETEVPMETCVLIPEDFTLKIDQSPRNLLSIPFLATLVAENSQKIVKLCSTKDIPAQTKYLPFSGTVRTDELPILPYLPSYDVSEIFKSCSRSSSFLGSVTEVSLSFLVRKLTETKEILVFNFLQR